MESVSQRVGRRRRRLAAGDAGEAEAAEVLERNRRKKIAAEYMPIPLCCRWPGPPAVGRSAAIAASHLTEGLVKSQEKMLQTRGKSVPQANESTRKGGGTHQNQKNQPLAAAIGAKSLAARKPIAFRA